MRVLENIFVYLFGFIGICSAVNISEWNDGLCLNPAEIPMSLIQDNLVSSNGNDVNDANTTVWYTPLSSTYEIYKTASMFLKISIDDVTEDDIKRSCVTTSLEDGVTVSRGFKNKKMEFIVAPGKHGGFLWKVKGDKKYRGEYWIVLTTSEYSLIVTCWANGFHSFAVASTSKKLDAKARKIVTDKAKSLGFNPKYFYDYNYDNCDMRQTFLGAMFEDIKKFFYKLV